MEKVIFASNKTLTEEQKEYFLNRAKNSYLGEKILQINLEFKDNYVDVNVFTECNHYERLKRKKG